LFTFRPTIATNPPERSPESDASPQIHGASGAQIPRQSNPTRGLYFAPETRSLPE